MKMLRHYFISDDLDDLEVIEEQLESAGIATPQIHVLTAHDAELDHHAHLHRVQSLMKKDLVHSTVVGAIIGVVLAALVLVVSHLAGWTQTAAGWVPFIFLAIIVLGFSTWEGGLFGMHKPNVHFARFEQYIKDDKHILFVDLEHDQEPVLERVIKSHPKLVPAGSESLHRHWFVEVQKRVPRFFKQTFP